MFTLDFCLLMSVNCKWDECLKKTLYILHNTYIHSQSTTRRALSSRHLSLSFGTVGLYPLHRPGCCERHLQGSPGSSWVPADCSEQQLGQTSAVLNSNLDWWGTWVRLKVGSRAWQWLLKEELTQHSSPHTEMLWWECDVWTPIAFSEIQLGLFTNSGKSLTSFDDSRFTNLSVLKKSLFRLFLSSSLK